MSAYFLFVAITMSEQVIPSAIAQRIIVKFLTNESVKLAEILRSLRAQLGDETLSRTQMCDWSKSFKEGRNMRSLYLLQEKLWSALSGALRASYSSIF
jgi:hypothetical protein